MVALIRHLHNRTYACHVFSLQSNGLLRRHLSDLKVPVYSGGLKRGDLSRAPWKLISAEWELIRLIRQLKPRVVHAFLPLVTFMGALAGRLNRVPLVITSRRALGTHQERFVVLRPIDLMADFFSHRVTVNSQAVWNDTINRDHINPSKLELIYNGVDPEPFELAASYREKVRKTLGVKREEKVAIVIANLISYKGHSDFVKAARQVIDQLPVAKFLLVGEDRGIQEHLQCEILELGISSHVKFLGQRDDIPQLLAACDISVVPSHEEGFSNTILESMAAGLPVVATSVGGNPEAVLDGATGWLVPPRNPKALAEKLMDLIENPAKAKAWGRRGNERVKRQFSLGGMVERHLRLYEGPRQGKGARNDISG